VRPRIIAAMLLAALGWCSVPAWALRIQRHEPRRPKSDVASHEHPCCPKANPLNLPSMLESPASRPLPCGDEHPCCAKQRRDNPAALPATVQLPRPDVRMLDAVKRDLWTGRGYMPVNAVAANPFQLSSLHSVVLRI
jgi:hypothetical protein